LWKWKNGDLSKKGLGTRGRRLRKPTFVLKSRKNYRGRKSELKANLVAGGTGVEKGQNL